MSLSVDQENGVEPIGAVCEIKYSDDEVSTQYFSFVGMSDEDDECDAAGVHDGEIFYYADRGESEIKSLMNKSDGGMNEFVVIGYKLSFKNPELAGKEVRKPRM